MKIEELSLQELATNSTSRLDLWTHIVSVTAVKAMAEVGVWRGDFTEQILGMCESIDRYYMIDPWAKLPDWNKPYNQTQEVFDNVYADAMSRTAFASNKIVVLRGRTKDVVDEIPDNSLDLAYIDGDHTLRGITIDLIRLLPKLKDNGLIGGDDFTNTPWQHDIRFEPTLVCPFSIYFAEAMNLPIVALPFNQYLMEKCVGSQFSFIDTTGRYSDISLNRLWDPESLASNNKPIT